MAIEIIGQSAAKAQVDAASLALRTALYDQNGNPIFKLQNGQYSSTDRFLPLAGVNESVFRPIEVDRTGSQRLSIGMPVINLQLYTAAIPPTWTAAGAVTQTAAVNTTTGVQLNSGSSGAISTYINLTSFAAITRFMNARLHFRSRLRLIKGGANGQADWGLSGARVPAGALHANAFVFLYGADGTLKPTVYQNSAVVAQGADFASLITAAPSQYYTWDIIVSDEAVTFVCTDGTTGALVNEQTLKINTLDPRFGMIPSWHLNFRSFVLASANVGAATQLFVADCSAELLDLGSPKPWADIQSGNGYDTLHDPTIVATQLANYANNAAPASATLSNTAAGYTTLGGQFQFAAVGGAETDYALFAWTCPANVRLNVTEIAIETQNTGAAVATTETSLQWFIGEALAITLASSSFRRPLGMQAFPIAAAIGALAAPISLYFRAPIVIHPGRILHVGLKMPRGTATASQIIRGVVGIGGYFD